MGTPFTAFPALVRDHNINPTHLVHVGAHLGEEIPWYKAAGFKRLTLIEPIPHLARRLRQLHPDATVIEAACSDQPGTADLQVMAKSNMSTIVPAGPDDKVTSSVRVELVRLDEVAADANVAVVDAQGAELAVLAAAPWASLDLLIVETCTVNDPTMAAPYATVVDLAARHGMAEAGRWVRDYQFVNRWARGRTASNRWQGEIRDVIFTKHR